VGLGEGDGKEQGTRARAWAPTITVTFTALEINGSRFEKKDWGFYNEFRSKEAEELAASPPKGSVKLTGGMNIKVDKKESNRGRGLAGGEI